MCLFIKQIRDLCLAKRNIVLQQWYTCFIFIVTIFNVRTRKRFNLAALPALVRCTFCISSECGSQFILYRQHHRRSISYSRTEHYWWKRQCMEWQGYIYVTCKEPIIIFWNYRKFKRYRSWSSRIISSHSWTKPHTISQKQSYDCRFMVKIITVITYVISTFWHKRSNS